MQTDKCPCIHKSESENIRQALAMARDIYRNTIKTLSLDITTPEYVTIEEKADKFNTLIYRLDKITCEEDKEIKIERIKQMTSEDIAKLPLRERIKIATAVAGTVSK